MTATTTKFPFAQQDSLPHISAYAIPVAGVEFSGTTYLFEASLHSCADPCFMPSERCDSQFLLQRYYDLLQQQTAGFTENIVVLCHEAELNRGDLLALARFFPQHQFYFAVPLQGRSFSQMQQTFTLPAEPNTHYGFYDQHSTAYIQWLLESQRLEQLFIGCHQHDMASTTVQHYACSRLHFNKLSLSLMPASRYQKNHSFFLISCRQHWYPQTNHHDAKESL